MEDWQSRPQGQTFLRRANGRSQCDHGLGAATKCPVVSVTDSTMVLKWLSREIDAANCDGCEKL